MSTKQLATLYTIVGLLFVGLFAAIQKLDKPMSAEQYANKICQQQHGPQTASYWVADKLMCITQRGEVLPIKRNDL
jgi:hypothetical protein